MLVYLTEKVYLKMLRNVRSQAVVKVLLFRSELMFNQPPRKSHTLVGLGNEGSKPTHQMPKFKQNSMISF